MVKGGLFAQTRPVNNGCYCYYPEALFFTGSAKISYTFFALNKNFFTFLYNIRAIYADGHQPLFSLLPTMSTQFDDRHSATSPLHKLRDISCDLLKLLW